MAALRMDQFSGAIRTLNDNYRQAARLLARTNGASVEELAQRLDLPEDSARALVSRLRTKGLKIQNHDLRRWRVVGVATKPANDR